MNPGIFRLTRRLSITILLVAIIVGAVLVYVYYSMSVTSVTTVSIDQVFADRNFVSGTYPNRNATFIIEVQVWSNAQALNVKLEHPVFLIDLAPDVRGSQTFGSATILPGSYLTYNLRFSVNESRDVGTISYSAANVVLGMTSQLTAGFYSQTATVTNSVTWNWTTATLIIDYGSCFNHCVP